MASENPQPDDMVWVQGAEGGGIPGLVSRKAYDTIWAARGFTIVDPEEAAMATSPATQAEMDAGAAPTPKRASKAAS